MSQSSIKQHFYVLFDFVKVDQAPLSKKEEENLVSCMELWMAHKKSKMVFEKQFSIKECRSITRNIMPISSLIKIIEKQIANPVKDKRLSTTWEVSRDKGDVQLIINISYTPDDLIGTRIFELRLPANASESNTADIDGDKQEILSLQSQLNQLQEQMLHLQLKHKLMQSASNKYNTQIYNIVDDQKSSAMSHDALNELVPKKSYFQPEALVFTFAHAHEGEAINDANNGQGSWDWSARYYHITTPIHRDTHRIYWRYTLKGYSYGAAYPIDIIFVGYIFGGQFYQMKAVNMHKDAFPDMQMEQYLDANNRLVLKFGPICRYCNTLSLYYQGTCGNKEFKDDHGLQVDQYKIQVTSNDIRIKD